MNCKHCGKETEGASWDAWGRINRNNCNLVQASYTALIVQNVFTWVAMTAYFWESKTGWVGISAALLAQVIWVTGVVIACKILNKATRNDA